MELSKALVLKSIAKTTTRLVKSLSVAVVASPLLCLAQGQGRQAVRHAGQLQNFPLVDVRLTSGPFYEAQQTDLRYILELSPDKLLSPYLREAGLTPKDTPYGNWESMGLDGHTAGHYLTALAQMYRATGSQVCQDRLTYMVQQLADCQDAAKNGYVGGVPGGLEMWAALKQGNFELFDKKWVPWYNLHKLFSGLRDAYIIAGNQQAKQVLIKLSDWADDELSGLSTEQIKRMLKTEYGGMNAVLADVYELTGNAKYLALAQKFSQPAFVEELADHQDHLTGLHANTQIPKVIGFEKIALAKGDNSTYGSGAAFFWNTVVGHRTVGTGGNSVYEHFNPINDFSALMESVQGPETCNSYNMLKLTELLFLSRPLGKYMDYYERTLYNQILATEWRGQGGFVYFSSLRPRSYRVFSTPDKDFWCCVGTGMENHGKYGEMIYSHRSNDLFVNLFIPSVLHWKERGRTITQSTRFPYSEKSEIKIGLKKSARFGLYIRKPSWLNKVGGVQFRIQVNGQDVDAAAADTDSSVPGYVVINRSWKDGDKVEITLPMETRLVQLPDQSKWACFMHGPVVLAAITDTADMPGIRGDGGRFDHIASGHLYPFVDAPLLVVPENKKGAIQEVRINEQVKITNPATLSFDASPLIYQAKYKHLKLIPFFDVNAARYMIYWPFTTPADVAGRERQLDQQDAKVLKLEQHTVDQVSPGEQQPEKDHELQFRSSETGVYGFKHWRSTTDFFSYQLALDSTASYIQVRLNGDLGKSFDLWVDNILVSNVLINKKHDSFFTLRFPVPEALTLKPNVTVTIRAVGNKVTPRLFDIRIMREK